MRNASMSRLGRRALDRVFLPRCISLKQQRRGLRANNSFLVISEEIREALYSRKPVVALETTIYTHGFPYPENIALASHLESVVRTNGGVPATIGVLDGVARVGMSPDDIIQLTSSAGQDNTLKLSRRDLSYVCGSRIAGIKFNGGTTIAGTMVLADLAGIKVFATGGLGGVHRGAASTMDISADLTELGRTPVTVVSSGCKSFLDIRLTLEYLETQGVGVATFADGREGDVDFPAFWSRDSGFRSPMVLQNESQAASMIHAQHSLGLKSGLLFANPIPTRFSISKYEMDELIAEAIRQADAANATGKDNTPFILRKLKELSGGRTIPANRALIEENVRRGTIVARELAALEGLDHEQKGYHVQQQRTVHTSTGAPLAEHLTSDEPIETSSSSSQANIIVAGAVALDLACDYTPSNPSASSLPLLHTSNPSHISHSLGGVAHNIALTLSHLGCEPRLLSFVAADAAGNIVLSMLDKSGLSAQGVKTLPESSGSRTPQYIAVNSASRDLHLAMADMHLLEHLSESAISSLIDRVRTFKPTHLVLDANLPGSILRSLLQAAKEIGAETIYEPVSVAKAPRVFDAKVKTPSSLSQSPSIDDAPLPAFPSHALDIATPNAAELAAMHNAAHSAGLFDTDAWWRVINALGLPASGSRHLLERAIVSSLTSSHSSTSQPLLNGQTQTPQALARQLLDGGIPQQALQLLPFIPTILTTLGPNGILLTRLVTPADLSLSSSLTSINPWLLMTPDPTPSPDAPVAGVYMRLLPPPEPVPDSEVVSVNAVGDTVVGAVVAGLSKGRKVEEVVEVAQRAAGLTLRAEGGVSGRVVELRSML